VNLSIKFFKCKQTFFEQCYHLSSRNTEQKTYQAKDDWCDQQCNVITLLILIELSVSQRFDGDAGKTGILQKVVRHSIN